MNFRKPVALILALLTVLALAACTPASPASTGDTPAATAAPADPAAASAQDEGDAPADPGAAKDYSEHLSITINYTDADKKGQDALYDFLCEKFNVDFEFIPMQFNERSEKARIWISTGDMPDVLWLDLDEKLFAEYANWVRQEMFTPFPDDIRTRWPNIGEVFNRESMIGDELMTIDGKLYAYPTIRNNPQYEYMSAMSWIYRKDWAEALGLAHEDDIYTWDEFVEMNRAFIEQDPGGNGAGKTLGIGTQIFYFPNHAGVWQISGKWGYGAFSPIDGEYKWTTALPETLEGLLITKKLYDDKIIWNDNALGASAQDQYIAGLMGSMFDNMDFGRTRDVANGLLAAYPDLDVEKAVSNCYVMGPNGDFWAKQSQCYWGAVVLSNKIDPPKVERILDIYDWLNSEDGYGFVNYGLEGVDYNKNADGSYECLWPVDPATGLQVSPYPSGSGITGYANPGDAYNSAAQTYPQWVMDNVNAKFQFNTENALIRAFDYESSYFSGPLKDASGNFVTETQDKMIELLTTSTYDNLANEWNAWLASMDSKVQPVLDELNAGIPNKPE